MVEMSVREAIARDLPSVLSLLEELDIGNEEHLSLGDAHAIFARLTEIPLHRVYVAEREGVIIGTFTLMLLHGLAHGGALHGLIEDVVVEPEWRDQGVGRQMMHFAMERCREAGCYKVALSSHLVRERTHAFYESLGFRKHGFSYVMSFPTAI